MKKLVTMIVPVFNNEISLDKFISKIPFNNTNVSLSVLFIDDGSTDQSRKIIQQHSFTNRHIKYIFFKQNFGQIAAIEAGLNLSMADANIFISPDLQDPIILINEMITLWENGSSIVIAYRNKRTDGVINTFVSNLFYSIIRRKIPKMPVGGFDFCLLDNISTEYLKKIKNKNRFFQGEILSSGFNTSFLPYERKKGFNNKPLKNFNFKVKYFFDGLFYIGIFPIRIITLFGVFISLMSFIYALIIAIKWYLGFAPFDSGSPILVFSLFSSGVLISFLGEYIWGFYNKVNDEPRYIIEKTNLYE